jgi:Replication initiator protein, pSAM2
MLTVAPVTDTDNLMNRHLRSAGYHTWRDKVLGSGGCSHPIHLSGAWQVADAVSGEILARKGGEIFAPCGNRRATVCPACSDRYAADAFHLVRAGLVGGHKGIPETVAGKPRFFVTLTAPSFGPVHTRTVSLRGRVIPCRCGESHREHDPRIGTAIDLDTYDYVGAVLWQAHSTALWHRFTTAMGRQLAHAAGIPERHITQHARLSYTKVAEYQRRGLIHFHAVIRLDGAEGPDDPAPDWASPDLLRAAITAAVQRACLPVTTPDGGRLALVWGEQLDIREITPATTRHAADPDGDGEITDQRLAAYIAKYATKGTGTTTGVDRPIRSQLHLDHLTGITEHHRRMIQTAWDLGALPEYADLNLRKWAHMLGFRGHFLTKSKAYSTTFKNIRETRQAWRANEALDRIGADPDTVLVVNHWQFTGVGHTNTAQRELAEAIYERQRQQRKHQHEKENALCERQ